MDGSGDRNIVERAYRVFFAPGVLEEEETFQSNLADLTRTGLQWGGLVGIIGVLVLVFIHWGLLGRPTVWWYPEPMSAEIFVLWDKAVVVLMCSGAIALGRIGCRLSVGRIVGATIAVVAAAVSLTHDAYRDILSVEYLILVYLLVVVVIPYRPWQALLLGGTISLVFYGIGHYGVPGTAAARPELVKPGHLVRMGFAVVVLTGVSALLYSTRYRQHRSRREAERLHEQVAELEQARSRFFADISHEFRTPLTLVLGSIREALNERFGTLSSALHGRLNLMEGQVRRMNRLVNQLLDLSKLDADRMALSMQEHDLIALTRRLLPPFREWAKDEGLSVRVDFDCDHLPVWIDAARFEEILANLLSTAIKYTPEEGAIRIRVRRSDDEAEIAVRDTGPGLPEHLQARVFDRDRSNMPVNDTAPSSSNQPEVDQWIGTGIGLAHTRALVQRHQGRIDVDTEPGFGTEFTVYLPLGQEHIDPEDVAEPGELGTNGADRMENFILHEEANARQVADDSPSEETTENPEDRPEVLVVDDEANMRKYLQAVLGEQYRVRTANDGDDALDRLRERPPDLVISDVVMPERDGVALCRKIREDTQLRHLPVLLLTAGDDDARLAELEAGADAYVSKPFAPEELKTRTENLIEIRRLVQDRVRVPDWMKPKEKAVAPEDAEFLESVNAIVDEHIDNSNFGVDWLADEMDLSSRHLRRRLKEVTRLSPAGFIRTRRLQHAAALLRQGAETVSDVAAAVGYRDPNYFSRLFRETFGCPPTEYAEKEQEPPEASDMSP